MIITRTEAVEAWSSHFKIRLNKDGETELRESLGPASAEPMYLEYATVEDAKAAIRDADQDDNVAVVNLPDEISVPGTLNIGDTVFVTENASAPIQETTISHISFQAEPSDKSPYDVILKYTTESGHSFASQAEEFTPRIGLYDKPGAFFQTQQDAEAWQDRIQGMQPAAPCN